MKCKNIEPYAKARKGVAMIYGGSGILLITYTKITSSFINCFTPFLSSNNWHTGCRQKIVFEKCAGTWISNPSGSSLSEFEKYILWAVTVISLQSSWQAAGKSHKPSRILFFSHFLGYDHSLEVNFDVCKCSSKCPHFSSIMFSL